MLLVLVAAGWWVLKSRVDDAKAELAAEDQVVTTLRADLADLNEFQQLQARVASTDSDLQAILGGEVSLAGLLQDVAAVMPTDVELQTSASPSTWPPTRRSVTSVRRSGWWP